MTSGDNSISVFAPATVSNVGPGFDFFGFALEEPGDIVTISINDNHEGVEITDISGDNGKLPMDASKNTAGIPVIAMHRDFNIFTGLDIRIKKQMGIGSGLGSSAASAVAAVVALNELMELELEIEDLLKYAALGESAASGSLHYDNIAPCLYGGFVTVTGIPEKPVLRVPVNSELYCAVIHPDIEIKTADARKILPGSVPREVAVTQAKNAAALILALNSNDFGLFRQLIKDGIAEPYRANLIPWYNEVTEAALAAGALNCNISGSGPAQFALAPTKDIAEKAGRMMQAVPQERGVKTELYISALNSSGPVIL